MSEPGAPEGRLADYFLNPRNVGELAGDDVVQASAGRREIGTKIDLFLRFQENKIASARFRAYGCPVTIASASRMCEWLEGRSAQEAALFDPHALAEELGVKVSDFQSNHEGDIIDRIQAHGGSLSHHHGVGLNKKDAMRAEHGEMLRVWYALKESIDPGNIMNPGKLFPERSEE